ncbi:hypothetical protein [Fluviicola chungangensis]|uniref:T9SS type A sorting domain-containing protein n=1 Tax=Fluviicola chungangensis TaxID=2597671 RepID=A0A556MMX9_9FLAO|nr:hypothetical protein [Fluviicola chungangensis]TSJ41172.1 hypothetical protein FO442_14765 [Fluviicola chungangensis]
MGRFISISLVAIIISNTVVFAQKHEPVPMRMLLQETVLFAIPFSSEEMVRTDVDQLSAVTINIYNNVNSNYLTLEVLGASKVMTFQLLNAEGQEMYAGEILGTQLVETQSWPAGTYYLLCGTKRETIDLIK